MITQTVRKISSFALTITMLGLVSGCSSQAVSPPEHHTARAPIAQSQKLGERAAAVALQQVGVPYRYGGSTTTGFDCSGLVQYSYAKAGKSVPRTTGQLWSSTSTVQRNRLQVGDLLFFNIDGKMSHVGMYVGKERFVHAPSSGRTVSVEDLNAPYYASALLRVGRPN
jgi:cell wall-associated NlpC family hydrolase